MRQLKFRILDTLAKHYVYPEDKFAAVHYWITLDGKVQNMQNGAGSPELVIQEWTGAQDENGKDIYEGDILKSTYQIAFLGTQTEKSTVEWRETTGSFIGIPRFTGKIIGNTFQNQELLQN